MARIRTIKPEFFTSEDIVALSPFARLLYIALWCEADREGRLFWKPKTFKIRYFPADDLDINALCEEILASGVVELYDDGLAHIPMFLKHQHINPRESKSELPEPVKKKARVSDASTTRESRDSDVQVGREGKEGKEHASVDAGFDAFWQAYPLKKSKKDAVKAWAKIKPNEHLAGKILQAVQRAMTSEDWTKDGGRYIPHASTWLNGERWNDEVQTGFTLTAPGGDTRFKGAK